MTLTRIRGNFKNECFFCIFLYFFIKIWKNADFLTKFGRDFLMDLTFRDFGVNEQNDLSIAAKLDISSNNIDFSWRQDCQYDINKLGWACGLLVLWKVKSSEFFRIEEVLLCIMWSIEFQVRTLCFAREGFHISMRNSYFENNECFGVWPKHNP